MKSDCLFRPSQGLFQFFYGLIDCYDEIIFFNSLEGGCLGLSFRDGVRMKIVFKMSTRPCFLPYPTVAVNLSVLF